jgi:hypothetical protein
MTKLRRDEAVNRWIRRKYKKQGHWKLTSNVLAAAVLRNLNLQIFQSTFGNPILPNDNRMTKIL